MSSSSRGQQRPTARFFGLTPSVRASAVAFLCLAIFLFWASLYVFVPILPVYAEALGASLSMVGVIVASYAIAQLLLRIPLGVWADVLGRRKPFLVAGFLAAMGGVLLLGLAPNPWLLFCGRTVTGIAAASWVAFSVFFAGYFPRRQTAQAMGIISATNGAAQVLASLLGGFTAQVWGWQVTFFVGAGLAVVGLPLLLLTPETPVERARPFSYRGFLKMPSLSLLLTVSFICILGQFAVHGASLGFVPLHGDRIGASHAELGMIMTVMFAASSAASLAVVYVVGRLGYSVSLATAFLLMALAFVWVPFIHSVPLLILSQALVGVGRGVFFPILMALSIRAIPPSERGTAMGVFQSLYAVGMLLGPLLLGFWADWLGLDSVFYLSAALCIMGGVVSLAPAIVRLRGQ